MNEQEVSTDLNIGDLKVIASLIEACTNRGFFKANELTIIGSLYNKISAILLSIDDDKDKGNQQPGN